MSSDKQADAMDNVQVERKEGAATPAVKPSQADLERARRRRMLKGIAMGVPMVATITPGTALAAISSNNCLESSRQTVTGIFTDNARCRADVTDDSLKQRNTGSGTGYIVRDRSEFSGGNTAHSDGILTLPTAEVGSESSTDDCLLMVDGNGNPILTDGAFGTYNTDYLVSDSCWSSFDTQL
uniref:Uncharacterized protein n=1 Tax=Magnetococcus massalia (strain MO-1) TaxID=451514 RepID=A0A1S7LKH5_MAGMO|nr:conserved protein of unknown function [Candidatus Magnetococcus massalia]